LDGRPRLSLDKNSSMKIVPGAPNPTIDLPGAIIHDWAGAILVPRSARKLLCERSAVLNDVVGAINSQDDRSEY
jgi:hypothetical protein